ncbi:MAG: energy transducer TonB, partial [Pseudomonadota bacterium]
PVLRPGGIGGLSVAMPDIDIEVDTGGAIQIARELTPLVRVPAVYPHSALMKGTEGYVTLRFTVTETGSVADPEVIAAEPAGVFERAAIRAVLRWKYQPQLANGTPISVVSRARIRFEMEQQP